MINFLNITLFAVLCKKSPHTTGPIATNIVIFRTEMGSLQFGKAKKEIHDQKSDHSEDENIRIFFAPCYSRNRLMFLSRFRSRTHFYTDPLFRMYVLVH